MTSGQCCNEGVCSIDRSHFNSSKPERTIGEIHVAFVTNLLPLCHFHCVEMHIYKKTGHSRRIKHFSTTRAPLSAWLSVRKIHTVGCRALRIPHLPEMRIEFGSPTSHDMSDHKGAKPSARAASAGCLHLAEMWMRLRLNHLTNVSDQRKNPNKTRRRRNCPDGSSRMRHTQLIPLQSCHFYSSNSLHWK
jgi:hypothetical protein